MKNNTNKALINQAKTILDTVNHLIKAVKHTDVISNSKIETEILMNTLDYMFNNACLIPAKIAGASNEDLFYDIKMQNAAIIRKAATELITDLNALEIFGFKELDYLNILRKDIETFRVLFAEWVKTFDVWNYTIDRWGLFNPPGVNYDDKDPDDDLPFNPNDLNDFFQD